MKNSKQYGYSLIELMVGMVVALIVIGGAITVFLIMSRSSAENIRADKLNHDIQMVLDVMTHEIRRIGYWNSEGASAPANNPLTYPSNRDFNIVGGSCILFAYDKDASGDFSDGEYGGFKLVGNEIYMRKAGTSLTNCSESNAWERITYASLLTVSNLQFTSTSKYTPASTSPPNPPPAPYSESRVITIALEANATGDTSRKAFSSSPVGTATASTAVVVRIRNNRMVEVP